MVAVVHRVVVLAVLVAAAVTVLAAVAVGVTALGPRHAAVVVDTVAVVEVVVTVVATAACATRTAQHPARRNAIRYVKPRVTACMTRVA